MDKLLSIARRVSPLLLALVTLFSCAKQEEDEPITYETDIVSPTLYFEIVDKSGRDLLKETDEAERKALLESLSILYEGKTYKVQTEATDIQTELRFLPSFFSGFTYTSLRNVPDSPARLAFGQLVGYKTMKHTVEFVWGNGKVETIVVDNHVSHRRNGWADIQNRFYLNGAEVKSDIIKLTKPE